MTLACARIGGINLAQGVCDTEVPLPVWTGVKEAIAKKMREYNGINADTDSDIIVSSGATGAFYCACLALLNPGDEVILFEP